jgi:hypothetical protein
MNGGQCRINALPFTPFGQLRPNGESKPAVSQSNRAQGERHMFRASLVVMSRFPGDEAPINRKWF